MYFYHYTSVNNAIGILEDKKILAKTPERARAHFKRGVYLTIHSPDETIESLIENNYIHFSYKYIEKVQCAFAIRKQNVCSVPIWNRFGRDIWRHETDIDLTRVNFKIVSRQNKCILDPYLD